MKGLGLGLQSQNKVWTSKSHKHLDNPQIPSSGMKCLAELLTRREHPKDGYRYEMLVFLQYVSCRARGWWVGSRCSDETLTLCPLVKATKWTLRG